MKSTAEFNVGRFHRLVFFLGVAFWLIQTWWFGWNMKPMSDAEALCDRIASAVITVGFVLGWKIVAR